MSLLHVTSILGPFCLLHSLPDKLLLCLQQARWLETETVYNASGAAACNGSGCIPTALSHLVYLA